jgi:hypothetical protein
MNKYSGLHRRQLFHWIGEHIEEKDSGRKELTDPQRKQYLECLSGSLDNGIWVKPPRKPDGLLDFRVVRADSPMACFTEWSVSDSTHHTRQYGRLGLGFTRSFILKWGGRPVTYLPATKRDCATRSIIKVADFLRDYGDESIQKHWRVISQFLKPMRPASTTKKSTVNNIQIENIPKKSVPPGNKDSTPKRSFGGVLPYLEEREWRIIYDGSKKGFKPMQEQEANGFYLPYTKGKDLFTLVLPDFGTYSLLVKNRDLMKKLFSENQPPVTILTLDDIDTF